MATASMPKQKSIANIPGRFGAYGGRYVPETLMAALDELERAYEKAKKDVKFRARLNQLLNTYAGRPTPLFFASRLTKKLGGAKFTLNAKTCSTQARTRLITVSGKRCSRSAWANVASLRKLAQDSMEWQRQQSVHYWVSTASSIWAPKTCGGRS